MKTCIRFISMSLLLFLLISCGNNNSSTIASINDPKLINVAKTLSTQGELKVTRNGYVYLKVSDDYSNVLYPLVVQHADTSNAPCIVPARNRLGNHITLFYGGKLSPEQIKSLPIDKTFNFQVKAINMVTKIKHWHERTEKKIWYVLEVDSPALSSSLNALSIPSYYSPFHISIARENFDANGYCIRRHAPVSDFVM